MSLQASPTRKLSAHRADIVVFLITTVYVAIELRWNGTLLSAIGDASISRSGVQDLVTEGRLLAAFGLTWALTRALVTASAKPAAMAVNIGVFCILVAGCYAAIDQLYDRVVRAIPATESATLFQLAVHRTSATQGIGEPAFVEAAKHPLTLVSWPLLLSDARTKASISLSYESARERAISTPLDKVTEAFPRIVAAQQQAAQLKAMAATAEAKFETGYAQYAAKSNAIDKSLWGKVSSRVLAGYVTKFKEETCGMVPSPNPTREVFAAELTHSCLLDRQQLGKWYLSGKPDPEQAMRNTVVYNDSGVTIKMGDILGMNEVQLKSYVSERALAITNDRLPTPANIKASEKNVDVIASVLLPPAALLLSLISVIANIGGLMGGLVNRYLQPLGAVLAVVLAVTVMPATAFTDPVFGELEAQVQAKFGFPAKAVSRLVSIEGMLT